MINWSSELRKKLQKKAQECKVLSEAHELEAYTYHQRHRRILMGIRIIGFIIAIMQIITQATKNNDYRIGIAFILLVVIHLITSEANNHFEYNLLEKDHIKTSADYLILYSNIILSLSDENSLELPKSSYSQYVFNTFNRIKNNSPYLRTKTRNSIKIKFDEPIDVIITNKRTTSLNTSEEIKNRLENSGINSVNDWEAYRLIYNL